MKINTRVFFILDKLQIRPAERFFVSSLIILIGLLWIVEPYLEPKSIYDDEYYAPLVDEFYRQASSNYQERVETLHRYYPGDEMKITEYAAMSIPDGSDSLIKERIINRAMAGMTHINGVDSEMVANTNALIQTNSNLLSSQDTIPKSKTQQVGSKVNLNEAKVTDLMKLPGIGSAIAQRIVDYRNENGDFKSIVEILKVKGIGPAKFEKMQDLIEL
ncbi:MAG TPA: hypothetical protein DCE78_02625 [Bacteroidetes bacterium]|nr:hypothetical protein [Bacteroidota bacterium]